MVQFMRLINAIHYQKLFCLMKQICLIPLIGENWGQCTVEKIIERDLKLITIKIKSKKLQQNVFLNCIAKKDLIKSFFDEVYNISPRKAIQLVK